MQPGRKKDGPAVGDFEKLSRICMTASSVARGRVLAERPQMGSSQMKRETIRVGESARCPGILWLGLIVVAISILAAPATAQRGDLNCDGAFNQSDVAPFVQALLSPAAYGSAFPACDITRADMNADSLVNGLDVRAFVVSLLAGLQTCPIPLTLCNGMCVDLTYNNGNCGACGNTCGENLTCVGGICQWIDP